MSEELLLKEKISRIWDTSSATFDSRPAHGIQSEKERQSWISLFREAFPPDIPLSILDIGCGTGELSIILAELGHRVSGLDLSVGMLQAAQRKSQEKNLTIEFHQGDAENPPFEPGTFDLVLERHVVWTLPNPQHAISQWFTLLKNGGRIGLVDGLLERGETVDMSRHIHPNYDPDTEDALPCAKGLSIDQAEHMLTTAGFSSFSLRDIGHIRSLQMEKMPQEQRISYQKKNYYLMTGVKTI